VVYDNILIKFLINVVINFEIAKLVQITLIRL
jgi:hypothetical protein